jgi:hypothetical protein
MTRGRQLQASGPDAYGKRRVLPAMTGQGFQPAGTCPACHGGSHVGLTCQGRTTEQVYRAVRRWPGTVYVPLLERDDR